MLIGVISDTHGHVEFTRPALEVFRNEGAERLLHCGDIGSPEVVRLFDNWPTHFVFGNADHDRKNLRRAIEGGVLRASRAVEAGPQAIPPDEAKRRGGGADSKDAEPFHVCHEDFGAIEWGGCRIAVLHGDDRPRLRETIAGGQWDLVCHGHTHVPRRVVAGPTVVLNPGAVFRARKHTVALVELPSRESRLIVLDGE